MFDGLYDSEKIKKENESIFPKESVVSFDGFVLSEIILREDFDSFFKTVVDLYCSDPAMKMSIERYSLKRMLNDINYRGNLFLPLIAKNKFPGVMRVDLPNSVKFIKIKIDKICADFVTLQITVLLEDNVTDDFNKIITSYHYPELIEHYNIPGIGNSYSVIDCTRRKRQHVAKFLDNLKMESLIFIESILGLGEFFKMQSDDWANNFPVINIFSYKGGKEKILSNRNYLSVIGFSYDVINTYKYEEEYLLSTYDVYLNGPGNTVFTVLIDGDKFKHYKIDFSPYAALDDFTFYLFSIHQWLKSIQVEIDRISNIIISFAHDFELIASKKEELIRLFVIFDRLKSIMSKFRIQSEIFNRIEGIDKVEPNFEKMCLNMINHFIESQDPIIKHTKDNINSLFELKNTRINIKSQVAMWWLTVVMLILAVVQVGLLEYDQNKHVYSLLGKGLKWLLSAIF